MTKTRCVICGEIGYTASPEHAECSCGGRLKVVIQEEEQEERDCFVLAASK